MNKTHIKLWDECLRIIADNIRPEQFDAWFKPITSLGFENGRLTLSVPSPFFAEHLENTYITILGATLRRVYGNDVKLFYHYIRSATSLRPESMKPVLRYHRCLNPDLQPIFSKPLLTHI